MNRVKVFKTRIVDIGGIPLGGDYPVRIQSMTNTNTLDTKTTVEQIIRITDAGAEYVRLSVRNIKEANNLINIKNEVRKTGYSVPLIADIHFNPQIAGIAAKIFEKVRINPGNFADKNTLIKSEYSEIEYSRELEKIRLKFLPLLKICKEYGTVLRIGVNHGSLSNRIISRFGDTTLGMVESAMEYLRICEEQNFNNVVLSMKSSNTILMIESTRLLVKRMLNEKMNYPLHLGVTEAGEGEDGRIKSSVGICSLLADGIGDTIRVSLTEEPENEIPVSKKIIELYKDFHNKKEFDFEEIKKREKTTIYNKPGNNLPFVISDISDLNLKFSSLLRESGYTFSKEKSRYCISNLTANFIYSHNLEINNESNNKINFITDFRIWEKMKNEKTNIFPLFSINDYLSSPKKSENLNFIFVNPDDAQFINNEVNKENNILVLNLGFNNDNEKPREFFRALIDKNIKLPVILFKEFNESNLEDFSINSSGNFGSLMVDGYGDGLWIKNSIQKSVKEIRTISFGILQACRLRMSKTEYISCPSCGRTMFNIQETTKEIKRRTLKLKGLKIAVMGCIVNGPGEMADADYGYVGGAEGRVNLYMNKQLVMQNIPEENAVNELMTLINKTKKVNLAKKS